MASGRKPFAASRSAENAFARALRKVARFSGHVVEAHVDGVTIRDPAQLEATLRHYSKVLEPWARRQAAKMLEKVARANKTSFTKNSKLIGKLIRSQVAEGPAGRVAVKLMAEQVALIQSIPIRAAERAQKLSIEAVYSGRRADEVAEELRRSGQVSESDAERIARTEVARANSALTEARATAVGSRQYVWRNSGDESVRHSHSRYRGRKLDGLVFDWDSPPTLDDGTTGHPGTFPNCRCHPEPRFSD